MNVARAIEAAIKKCGQQVVLEWQGEKHTFVACILPKFYNLLSTAQPEHTRFGRDDARHYVYYGPVSGAGNLVEDGCVLDAAGKKYLLSRCHDFECGGERVFRWAIARKISGEDGDESI